MKLFRLLIFTFLSVFALFFIGCKGDETTTTTRSPEVSILGIKTTDNSVTFTLTPKNAVKVEYSVTKEGSTAIPVVVDMIEAETITIGELVTQSNYTIKAVAINKDNTKSLAATLEIVALNQFHRNILIQKFTGTWNEYCLDMTAAIKEFQEANPNRSVVMAMHKENIQYPEMVEKFQIDQTKMLFRQFGLDGLPSAMVDYRDSADRKASEFERALKKSLDYYHATSGIAIESKVAVETTNAVGTINVEAKLSFTQKGSYKIVCAVIENGISEPGTAGSSNGIYNNVIRHIDTHYNGDVLEDVKVGEEKIENFEILVGSTWNIDNCEIVVYVQKRDKNNAFRTNNVAKCPAKGSVDYAYEE